MDESSGECVIGISWRFNHCNLKNKNVTRNYIKFMMNNVIERLKKPDNLVALVN